MLLPLCTLFTLVRGSATFLPALQNNLYYRPEGESDWIAFPLDAQEVTPTEFNIQPAIPTYSTPIEVLFATGEDETLTAVMPSANCPTTYGSLLRQIRVNSNQIYTLPFITGLPTNFVQLYSEAFTVTKQNCFVVNYEATPSRTSLYLFQLVGDELGYRQVGLAETARCPLLLTGVEPTVPQFDLYDYGFTDIKVFGAAIANGNELQSPDIIYPLPPYYLRNGSSSWTQIYADLENFDISFNFGVSGWVGKPYQANLPLPSNETVFYPILGSKVFSMKPKSFMKASDYFSICPQAGGATYFVPFGSPLPSQMVELFFASGLVTFVSAYLDGNLYRFYIDSNTDEVVATKLGNQMVLSDPILCEAVPPAPEESEQIQIDCTSLDSTFAVQQYIIEEFTVGTIEVPKFVLYKRLFVTRKGNAIGFSRPVSVRAFSNWQIPRYVYLPNPSYNTNDHIINGFTDTSFVFELLFNQLRAFPDNLTYDYVANNTTLGITDIIADGTPLVLAMESPNDVTGFVAPLTVTNQEVIDSLPNAYGGTFFQMPCDPSTQDFSGMIDLSNFSAISQECAVVQFNSTFYQLSFSTYSAAILDLGAPAICLFLMNINTTLLPLPIPDFTYADVAYTRLPEFPPSDLTYNRFVPEIINFLDYDANDIPYDRLTFNSNSTEVFIPVGATPDWSYGVNPLLNFVYSLTPTFTGAYSAFQACTLIPGGNLFYVEYLFEGDPLFFEFYTQLPPIFFANVFGDLDIVNTTGNPVPPGYKIPVLCQKGNLAIEVIP